MVDVPLPALGADEQPETLMIRTATIENLVMAMTPAGRTSILRVGPAVATSASPRRLE